MDAASAPARKRDCTAPFIASIARARPSPCCRARCATPTITPSTSPARPSRSTATWSGTSTCPGTATCERCTSSPGSDNGYRNGSGKFPSYYLDSLPPVRDLGRGSPVGVEFYQHHVYPAEFHDAYLEADWSRGRILWTALVAQGAGFRAAKEKDEFVHGEPLNVTDLEVGPDGFVYFTIGGRMTEGGFFASATRAKSRSPRPPASSPSSASRSRFRAGDGRRSRRPGRRWARRSAPSSRSWRGTRQPRASIANRRCYILQRHGPKPGSDLLEALVADKDAKVRAAAVYVAGQHADAGGRAVVAAALKDADPMVLRRAAEALVRQGLSADAPARLRRRRPVCAAQLARSSSCAMPAVRRCSARRAASGRRSS